MKQLVLGGARSGKSGLAEKLAAAHGDNIAYIATANTEFNDAEMDKRIKNHQQQRPSHWQTIETSVELATCLANLKGYDCIMIDCLTLWLSNCLHRKNWVQQQQLFLSTLESLTDNIVIVSNEVGMGIVPLGELSREFVDESGFLHQAVAQHCDRVVFTVAGLPLVMKGEPLI